MFGITQVLAFDDKAEDLNNLVTALGKAGISCRGIRWDGQEIPGLECPHARIIFMDVHLLPNPIQSRLHDNFSAIADLLDKVQPQGPYLLVLWTINDEKATELETFLHQRLEGTTKPFMVIPLPKTRFMTKGVIDRLDELTDSIKDLTLNSPAMTVLLDWEEKALAAVADTISSITLVGDKEKSSQQQQAELPRLLTQISAEATSKTVAHHHPFRAINEALAPVLSDRISAQAPSNQNTEVWNQVFTDPGNQTKITQQQAAKLHRAIHIDLNIPTSPEPGTVFEVNNLVFATLLGQLTHLPQSKLAYDEFKCKKTAAQNQDYRWVLVQTQAPCDYAQNNAGFTPFHLGIEYQTKNIKNDSHSAYLWLSPPFTADSQIKRIAVNARFPVSLSSKDIREITPIYRIRTQLLAELLHRIHTHGSRPGVINIPGNTR